MIDFFPGDKPRPKSSPYQLEITDLGKTPPVIGTTDLSKDVPGITGSFLAGDTKTGSIGVKLDGRTDNTSAWFADTWTGGDSCPIKGSEAGLGIGDEDGGTKVDGGEAIIWSFDLSRLRLAAGESLLLTSVDFGGDAEGKHAQFWQRTGRAGSTGAGKRIAAGGSWKGAIRIADGDEFALAGSGRLRSLTLEFSSTTSRPKSETTALAPKIASRKYDASTRNIIMILADDNYLESVDARRPRDNSAAYLADEGKQFEADDNSDRRDACAPFEGSRKPSQELNDDPTK